MLLPPPPTLSEHIPSGAPVRLLEDAKASKERFYNNSTIQEKPRDKDDDGLLPVLPPDITRNAFNNAIAELTKSLGEPNVVLTDKPLVDGWYLEHPNTHDAFHVHSREDTISSATVYPGSTEEVQTIVKWANKHLIPIYPISMGRNLGYGGAAPRVRGSIVMDLGKRMNKILKIDGDNCSCLLEPGVTYFALYEAVQKSGYPLWIDTTDVGGGSVLGNALDRGVGYTPYGDHFGNHCGMEVVLPTGDIVRLGMGALPGKDNTDNPTWQSFQYGYGPYSDGIFTQSNYGIVTKMGFWLMPATEHLTFAITFAREDDFERIIDIIRPLSAQRVLGNVPQIRHVTQELAVTGIRKKDIYAGDGPVPEQVIREHMKATIYGDVTWIFYATVYGPKDSRNTSIDVVRKAFSVIPDAKFIFPDDVPPDHYLHARVAIASGVPMLTDLDWLHWKSNGSHLAFSPISPVDGKDARKLYEMVQKRHGEFGFDMMPAFCIAPREMHFIDIICYDRGDEDEKRRAIKCIRAMIADAAKEGYGEYRTHILLSDQVAATYNWNNAALMRLNETLKDALDPNGILAPGKAGIWPKRFREKGWEILGDDDRTWTVPGKI
ncbi:vanillyl alcohol oxidase [Sphaerobolus stellatus SS14]|uniref:Vanillyl alcohol oxidase n=1 Tax=Sphaerobolus stellatus (strain SS14) TaxID=990650 RepID=A0A0C9U3K6_SPHS4|nr:vanillyl alcohol oxidase [Sphaerobolus stellatus SS14]